MKQICLSAFNHSGNHAATVEQYAHIWRSLDVFGKLKAKAIFYPSNCPPTKKNAEVAIVLGQDRPWKQDFDCNERILGGVDVYEQGKSTAETLEKTSISIGVMQPSRWNGLATPAVSTFVATDAVLGALSVDELHQIFLCHLTFASSIGAYYGVVDIDEASRMLAGNGFHSANVDGLPLDRLVLHANWVRNNFPKRMAMSVFWGNYFGPEMLQRMGGEETLKGVIATKFYDDQSAPEQLHHTVGDGCFVRLSRSPFDWFNQIASRHFINRNAIYLHQFLATHGLL